MKLGSLACTICLAGCTTAPAVDPAAHCPARDEIQCATDIGGMLPATLSGDTTGREDGYGNSRCGIGGGIAIEDVAYRWTAPRAGHYRFSTEGSSFDTIVSVRRGSCGGSEIACNDDVSDTSTASVVSIDLLECDTVTVVVDGHDGAGIGPFALAITASEALCEDGTDDDLDGLADCDDPDCAGPRCEINAGDWPEPWAVLEREVVDLVNEVRATGTVCDGEAMPPVPALERDILIENAARLHSLDMSENAYLSHDSLDGRTLDQRISNTGFTGPGPIGENIAAGSPTAEEVMAAWLSSPGHCRNIMNLSYRVIGVGFADADGGDGPRWTQDFAAGH